MVTSAATPRVSHIGTCMERGVPHRTRCVAAYTDRLGVLHPAGYVNVACRTIDRRGGRAPECPKSEPDRHASSAEVQEFRGVLRRRWNPHQDEHRARVRVLRIAACIALEER